MFVFYLIPHNQVYKNAIGHIYVAEVMDRRKENITEQVHRYHWAVSYWQSISYITVISYNRGTSIPKFCSKSHSALNNEHVSTYVGLYVYTMFKQWKQCHQWKGRVPLPKRINFWKSAKEGRGGVIFNQKIYVVDFGNFKQGLLIMKLLLNSNFRVQSMFFNNCIEKNQNKTHFEEATSESLYYLAIIPPRIYM